MCNIDMQDLDSYRIVGNYQISNMCLMTYPCQHTVINVETNKKQECLQQIFIPCY